MVLLSKLVAIKLGDYIMGQAIIVKKVKGKPVVQVEVISSGNSAIATSTFTTSKEYNAIIAFAVRTNNGDVTYSAPTITGISNWTTNVLESNVYRDDGKKAGCYGYGWANAGKRIPAGATIKFNGGGSGYGSYALFGIIYN